jgi:hypothetical protein
MEENPMRRNQHANANRYSLKARCRRRSSSRQGEERSEEINRVNGLLFILEHPRRVAEYLLRNGVDGVRALKAVE